MATIDRAKTMYTAFTRADVMNEAVVFYHSAKLPRDLLAKIQSRTYAYRGIGPCEIVVCKETFTAHRRLQCVHLRCPLTFPLGRNYNQNKQHNC